MELSSSNKTLPIGVMELFALIFCTMSVSDRLVWLSLALFTTIEISLLLLPNTLTFDTPSICLSLSCNSIARSESSSFEALSLETASIRLALPTKSVFTVILETVAGSSDFIASIF